MLDIFQTFENQCLTMAPTFILPIGICLTGIGLCLWLGGLNWPRIAGAFMGASIAAVTALFLPMLTVNIILAVIAVAAVVGLILDKPAIIFSGGIFAGIISLIIFAPAIRFSAGTPSVAYGDMQTQTSISVPQSASLGYEWVSYYATGIYTAISQNDSIKKAISTGISLAVIFIGIALRRIISAIACSVIGTAVVFSGMITLLLYKGSQPLTIIYEKPPFYTTVAVCMIIFGTVTELLLCPAAIKKTKPSKNGEQK